MTNRIIKQAQKKFEKEFPVRHYYCEDPWYSCPQAPEGCANKDEGDECNCGALERQKRLWKFIDQAITQAVDEAYYDGYKQGVFNEIECVETSGEHLSLKDKLTK